MSTQHIILAFGKGQASPCVACGLCAAQCPVQCIRVDWKSERLPGAGDNAGAPVQTHLGTLILSSPLQDVPPRSMLDRSRISVARGRAQVHVGSLVPLALPSGVPQRVRKGPTLFRLDHRQCTRCGLCVRICPVKALRLVTSWSDGTEPGQDLLAGQAPAQPGRCAQGARP